MRTIERTESKTRERSRERGRSGRDDREHVVFYSKSKDVDARYLSTMTPPPAPLVLDVDGESLSFPSMEHAFQALKYSDPELRRLFCVGGVYGELEPTRVKSKGGKKAMALRGVSLDVPAWNARRDRVMADIAAARARVDPAFSDLLRRYAADGVELLHFERSRTSHWGGHVARDGSGWRGGNALGRIYMALGATLSGPE